MIIENINAIHQGFENKIHNLYQDAQKLSAKVKRRIPLLQSKQKKIKKVNWHI